MALSSHWGLHLPTGWVDTGHALCAYLAQPCQYVQSSAHMLDAVLPLAPAGRATWQPHCNQPVPEHQALAVENAQCRSVMHLLLAAASPSCARLVLA